MALTVVSAPLPISAERNKNSLYIISVLGVLFFMLGFITWLNGTLIQFLKLVCQLKGNVQPFFVTFAFFMAYFVLAIPSSFILKSTGYKKGMALGLFVMAIGSIIFIPAANSRGFSLFLTALFTQGMGFTLVQTAINPYISIVGPIESAAKRMSIMGICNKVAGIMSPLILGIVLLNNATKLEENIEATVNPTQKAVLLDQLSQKIITPYIVLTIVLVLLAALVYWSSLPEIKNEDATTNAGITTKTSVFQYPHLMLGILCLFLYVGVEVMAGDAIGSYGRSLGLPLDKTKSFTSYTLFFMLVGYVIGIITIPICNPWRNIFYIDVCNKWLYIHNFYSLNGLVECADVACYLAANAKKPWTIYTNSCRLTDHGHSRRRINSFIIWLFSGSSC